MSKHPTTKANQTDASNGSYVMGRVIDGYHSPKLWCMRGDLIQLASESCPHSLDDARACYQRAAEIDPQFAEAWESLGHFLSAVLDDEPTAQRFFTEAERLRGHPMA